LIIGFQDTVENVGDVFLGHSVVTSTTNELSAGTNTDVLDRCCCASRELCSVFLFWCYL